MAQTAAAGFPLSVQQRRIWDAGAQRGRGARALRLEGELDAEALRRSLGEVVARHEALRTNFARTPGLRLPLQVIGEGAELDWRSQAPGGSGEADETLGAAAARVAAQGFDPAADPPMVARLLTLGPELHGLVVALPGVCADDASLDVVVEDLATAYSAALGGPPPERPDPVHYADFGGWQESLADEDGAADARALWRERDEAAGGARALPFEAMAAGAAPPAQLTARLDREALRRLEEVARACGASPADVLAAAWHALLWRLDQPPALGVGHVLDGRPLDDLAGAVGPYAQSLPMVTRPEPGLPFERLVHDLAAGVSQAAGAQQFYGAGGDPPAAPLPWQFEWRARPGVPEWKGLRVETAGEWPFSEPHAVKLHCRPGPDGVDIVLSHDRERVPAADAQHLLGGLLESLDGAMADPATAVDSLPLMSASARREVLSRRSPAPAGLDARTLHQAIEQQAARTPDAPAVEFADRTLTYSDLVAASHGVAARLAAHGVGPDTRVAICMERCAEYVTAIVGVLMAGGCYVPLDADYPARYIERILADADARALITRESLRDSFAGLDVPLVCPGEAREASLGVAEDLGGLSAGPDNLAYAIYTSGSTGEPKGVEVTHRSALALAGALRQTVYAGEEGPLRVSVNAPFTFDASVKQIVQLAFGDVLHVLPGEIRLDSHALSDHLEHRAVDVLDCTPSQLRPLLHAIEIHQGRRHPRIVLVGGEAVGADLWSALRQREGMAAWNVYGPTETTVDATVAAVADSGETPTIGRPLPGVQALVLDAALQPVPPGVLGELCIGGWGVARGYVGAPEATSASFVEHPDPQAPGERLFRTGDLARLRGDGAIDYLGRRDRQVKLRGFRVGLVEIEAALARHPEVAEVAVVDVTTRAGTKRLSAFVVAPEGDDGLAAQLEAHAAAELPEHMRPADHFVLDALPVTSHGKVDLARLREEAVERLESGRSYVAPRTPTEETLAEIWAGALETERVGVEDDFFDLGGDSILQIVVVARAQERGLELTPRDLFEHPTIGELAAVAEGAAPAR